MVQTYRFVPLERVHFGAGSRAEVPTEVERLGAHRVLLLSSRTLEAHGVAAEVADALGPRHAATFSDAFEHVPHDVVLRAASRARAADVDAIVTLGGSSVHDLAKAVALCMAEGLTDIDGLRARAITGEARAPLVASALGGASLPIVAISTTLSAGEFTPGFGVTERERGIKHVYLVDALTPRTVVLDPELARYTPGWLWASTGIRAVDHCVETLYSAAAQPVTDALAVDALGRLARNLPSAVASADDVSSRLECMVAAWESFFGVVNVFTGLSHALGHQLGARFGIPHGMTSCVVLPHVMAYNLSHTQPAQARVARALGVEGSDEQIAPQAADRVRDLVARLKLPGTLRVLDVPRDQLRLVAEDALGDFSMRNNPRPVASLDEVADLLDAAW